MKALTRLKELYLCRVELTEEQLVSLFEVVVGGSFRDVHLSAMDLSQVDQSVSVRGGWLMDTKKVASF